MGDCTSSSPRPEAPADLPADRQEGSPEERQAMFDALGRDERALVLLVIESVDELSAEERVELLERVGAGEPAMEVAYFVVRCRLRAS